jgi:hypothetical protein
MPIYDQSYRPYRGTFSSHAMRWWTITRTGVLHVLSGRKFLVFLTLTFINPIVHGFMIYFANQYPEQSLVAVDAEFFRRLLEIQSIWFLLLGIYPGTGLISNDLRWNAIQLYLSKPLTKVDYVLGKFAILGTFLMGTTFVPGLLLFFLQIGFSSDLKWLTTYWWIPFALAGWSLVATICWSLIVLALSSMSRNSRYVGIMLVALAFASSGFANFTRGIFNHEGMIIVSGLDDLKIITYLFFGGNSEYGDQTFGALMMLAILAAASALILRMRVKAVEVVA